MSGVGALKGQNPLIANVGVNPLQVTFYLINEHAFYISNHPEEKVDDLIKKDEYISFLASVSLDKYFTNEHLAFKTGNFVSRFSPEISTLNLYLNFILGVLSRYRRNDPKETLVIDVMDKGFQIAKCVSTLLEGGYETEAFSSWRTLHENECILSILVKHGKPVITEYLKHIQYGIAFRGGIPSKEETDKIFVQIKDEMRAIGLKSKDIKRYIEYGWLVGVKGVLDIPDFKFNFRDGVERVAELNNYSKVYEMSSEIAHSSPLLIYSKKGYFFFFTLLNLYESFFRLEKIFTTLYLSSVSKEEQEQYKKMRQLYYWEIVAAYQQTKKNFARYQSLK